ncbi:protein of unknown function DUF1824 [Leptolyngbyaceae cyanobacterium JSC-12]|nr:protein of unknown function DUF1824 [Leptolyngbyaceae cyanobacterium JSC-12]
MPSNSISLTLDAAQKLLRQFICIERIPPEQQPDKATIQQAVMLVRDHSDYQILGICADTANDAIATLHAYLTAFGFSEFPQPSSIEGAVYLKFNPKTGLCYLEPYDGTHRGVLISCQSAYEGDINATFGHLPLDLFS